MTLSMKMEKERARVEEEKEEEEEEEEEEENRRQEAKVVCIAALMTHWERSRGGDPKCRRRRTKALWVRTNDAFSAKRNRRSLLTEDPSRGSMLCVML